MNEDNKDKAYKAIEALRTPESFGLLYITAGYEENSTGGFDVMLKSKYGTDQKTAAFQVNTRKEAAACVRFVRIESR